MRRKREIEFAFDADAFKAAVDDVTTSIKNKSGKIVEIKMGDKGDTGIAIIEEDI
jgi:hypothetical protein